MNNKMRPIHPGKILEEELEELGISANALAKYLAVPPNRITFILNGKRAITADTALRLAKFFGTTPEFWLNLQSDYDLKQAIKKNGKKIERNVLTCSEAAYKKLRNS
jgi:addiction module HigA family antidote